MAVPSPAEIRAATARLRSVLEARTQGDYAPSTALGDLVVDGHAVAFADIVAELREQQARQSLAALRRATPNDETDDATDALLGNLFVDRASGSFARGVATLHFTQRVDALIARGTRFFKTAALVFYPNIAESLFIPSSSLRPRYDTQGVVTSWTYDVPIIAARVGSAYGVSPGRFTTFDAVSPYLSFVENSETISPGRDIESSAEAIARAPSAISLRAPINARSNDAVLRAAVAEVARVASIGFGDPEMRRDRVGLLNMHVGGHVDVYADLPPRTDTVRTTVGADTLRADGRVLTFSAPGADFVTANVRVGDILNVTSGLPGAPAQWRIAAVRTEALDVESDVPFAVATDEDVGTPDPVLYSVGNNYPAFNNRVAATTSSDVRTTRQLALPGVAFLPAGPLGRILRIAVSDPPLALQPFVDPTTGSALFTTRRNGPATRAPAVGEALSYRVICLNPAESQSARAIYGLELSWPGETLDGVEVEVTYESAAGFDAVHAVFSSAQERILAANTLARAPHPVYVSCSVPYRQRTVRDFGDTVAAVNEAVVISAIVAAIDGAAPGSLDVSEVMSAVRTADPNVGAVLPFELRYDVYLPDGRIARMSTPDRVELTPVSGSGARLLAPSELGLTAPTGPELARLLADLGVTHRTVRYAARADLVAVGVR